MKNCRPRPGSAYPAFLSTNVVPVAFGLPAEHLWARVMPMRPAWGTLRAGERALPAMYRKELFSVYLRFVGDSGRFSDLGDQGLRG